MKTIEFKAKCQYEIGDKIQFEKPSNAYYKGETKVMEITDIIVEKSEKTGRINFVLELDGWYKLDTKLHVIKTM